MSEEQYTRCPACKTVFRVTDAQLALRDGMVRCGHCQTIFDGRAEMISLAPTAAPDESPVDESLLGPPTVTLRSARSLQPVSVPRRGQDVEPRRVEADRSRPQDIEPRQLEPRPFEPQRVEPQRVEPHLADDDSQVADDAAGPTTIGDTHTARATAAGGRATAAPHHAEEGGRDDAAGEDEVDFEHRFAWDKPAKRPRRTWAYVLAIVLLSIALVGQVAYHFRDTIAARWPASRAALGTMCAALRCEVRPLRDVSALSIESSDLQVDPAHKGLLVLTATVRNRAPYTIAYPYLELTLTDAGDQVVVRRAFAPSEYMGGTVDVAAGLGGNAEATLKLFIDASATQQAGYRLYLFYP